MIAKSSHKVVVLRGSPRADGNSDKMADAFANIAKQKGVAVTDIALRDLHFLPVGIVPEGHKDDLTPVVANIKDAQIVVLSSPIYFCAISGLLKGALDRFFAFLKPDYLTNPQPSNLTAGKRFVLLQAQGEGEDRYGDTLTDFAPALDKLGFADRYLVRACNVREPTDLDKRTDVLDEIAALANRLVDDIEVTHGE